MSGEIGFDKKGLQEISESFASLCSKMALYRGAIKSQIDVIRLNWSGDEFTRANVDLTKILTSLDSIQSNCDQINKAINTTSSNFEQIKYNS